MPPTYRTFCALNASDISTLVHEIGHTFLRDLGDNDLNILARLGVLKDAAQFKDLETKFWNKTATEEEAARYRNVEEMFAQSCEKYLAERSAPMLELRSMLKRFTDWILNVYEELRKVGNKVLILKGHRLGWIARGHHPEADQGAAMRVWLWDAILLRYT